jgi:hypothetical protein
MLIYKVGFHALILVQADHGTEINIYTYTYIYQIRLKKEMFARNNMTKFDCGITIATTA